MKQYYIQEKNEINKKKVSKHHHVSQTQLMNDHLSETSNSVTLMLRIGNKNKKLRIDLIKLQKYTR